MDMGIIMVWLGPILQVLFEKIFEQVFAGWFSAPVEEVVAYVSRAGPAIADSGIANVFNAVVDSGVLAFV